MVIVNPLDVTRRDHDIISMARKNHLNGFFLLVEYNRRVFPVTLVIERGKRVVERIKLPKLDNDQPTISGVDMTVDLPVSTGFNPVVRPVREL
jgi:hypothetical protein